MVDWRQLRRWGISETQIPPGSVVRYKEFSVWELYKWRIVGAISLHRSSGAGYRVAALLHKPNGDKPKREALGFAQLAESAHQHLNEIVAKVPGVVWEARAGSRPSHPENYLR